MRFLQLVPGEGESQTVGELGRIAMQPIRAAPNHESEASVGV